MDELIIVRHGETAGQSSVRLYGKTDIPLSDVGREQMKRAGECLKAISFQNIFTSPLVRSMESAAIIIGDRGPAPVIIEGFREIDFGNWEGWTLEEAEQRDPDNYAEWKKGSVEYKFPGGDRKSEFFSRASQTALKTFYNAPLPTLAVLHKGVIKAALGALLDIPMNEISALPVELGCIHRLKKNGNLWKLVSSNETDHMGNVRIKNSR